jgi:hypothetical protein
LPGTGHQGFEDAELGRCALDPVLAQAHLVPDLVQQQRPDP